MTVAAGVPTIWIGMLSILEKEPVDLTALRAIYCGGSAVPRSLIEGLYRKGVNIVHAWGMTETSPWPLFLNSAATRKIYRLMSNFVSKPGKVRTTRRRFSCCQYGNWTGSTLG